MPNRVLEQVLEKLSEARRVGEDGSLDLDREPTVLSIDGLPARRGNPVKRHGMHVTDVLALSCQLKQVRDEALTPIDCSPGWLQMLAIDSVVLLQ